MKHHHHPKINATHHLAARTLNVTMVFALVYQNIKAIHTLVVDRNACLIPIVQEIRPAYVENASIHVRALAHRMLSAMLLIMFPCVVVRGEWKETRLFNVYQKKVMKILQALNVY